jgi:hypothetical protein
MDSFIGISKAHTTNLAVVAPGIAEALLATALGLVAAIPAVMIYNVLAGTAPCSATRRAMHRNFPCFSILGLTSIRALLSAIRDMTAMPAASPRTESDRADRHRRAAHYRAGNAALRPISRRLPHGRPVKPVNAVKNSSGRV